MAYYTDVYIPVWETYYTHCVKCKNEELNLIRGTRDILQIYNESKVYT